MIKALLTFLGLSGRSLRELSHWFDALNSTHAVIEFDMKGNILNANANFLEIMGYRHYEIKGLHHSIFIDKEYKNSTEYKVFWDELNRGIKKVAEFQRLGKNDKAVWIHAAYTPLLNRFGRPYKVVKFATDLTQRKKQEVKDKLQAGYANALRLCQANVMLADNDLNITYLNDTAKKMMEKNEDKIKEVLTSFSVKNLVGTNVDSFHVKPNHQRHLLNTLNGPYSTQIKINGLTFGLIASPWMDTDGNRLGTLVEWEDKTQRLAKEEESKRIADENLRVRQALDVCDTSVMMADDNLNIIYMNNAVSKMLKDREKELKEILPNFNTQTLIGTCIDDFHKHPSVQRSILRDLKNTYKTDIKVSHLTFRLLATPLFDAKGKRLGMVVEWDDLTEKITKDLIEKNQARKNALVKQALNKVTANVMIADEDANIIYLNNSVQKMMKHAESDIQSVLSNFDASHLVGKNIDQFHKNPHHQRNILKNLTQTYNGKVNVGGRSFTLIANPVFLEDTRVGTVVEWTDRTSEISIEKEIDGMVDAVNAGDFTQQLTTQGKTGFFKSLSVGLNTLTSTVEVALNDVSRVLGAMAKGDLSERITRDYKGTFGQLKNDANITADILTDVITTIRTSSNAISIAANEIAQGNEDLSLRTEEQASSLEETASSMEQMTSAVKQSAENAQCANTQAGGAQKKAEVGGRVVERAVSAMEDINTASKKISDIIGVIDEIAFQTNLLALNAAVEAARAGEQGRGFAVVAGEVRNLAQRSAGAAKEIKDLIRDSVTKVGDGTRLVNESGQTLGDIVASVSEVSVMMNEIADAAKEQTSGIEQVNTAITQMDEMTQQNAALVEEASAAGESMAEQSRSLLKAVEFFTVSCHQGDYCERDHKKTQKTPMTKPLDKKPISSKSYDDEWEDF